MIFNIKNILNKSSVFLTILYVSAWLTSVPDNQYKAYCKFCRAQLCARLQELQTHVKTRKHNNNALVFKSSSGFLSQTIVNEVNIKFPILHYYKKNHHHRKIKLSRLSFKIDKP